MICGSSANQIFQIERCVYCQCCPYVEIAFVIWTNECKIPSDKSEKQRLRFLDDKITNVWTYITCLVLLATVYTVFILSDGCHRQSVWTCLIIAHLKNERTIILNQSTSKVKCLLRRINRQQSMAGLLSRRLCPSTSRNINLWTCGLKSRHYEVISLIIHFDFCDLLTSNYVKFTESRTWPSD